jgi:hypothetical protein
LDRLIRLQLSATLLVEILLIQILLVQALLIQILPRYAVLLRDRGGRRELLALHHLALTLVEVKGAAILTDVCAAELVVPHLLLHALVNELTLVTAVTRHVLSLELLPFDELLVLVQRLEIVLRKLLPLAVAMILPLVIVAVVPPLAVVTGEPPASVAAVVDANAAASLVRSRRRKDVAGRPYGAGRRFSNAASNIRGALSDAASDIRRRFARLPQTFANRPLAHRQIGGANADGREGGNLDCASHLVSPF